MKKKIRIVSVILIGMLLLGTFFDLQINKIIYQPESSFSYILEIIAPILFANLLIIGASFMLFTSSFRNNIVKYSIQTIVYVLTIATSLLLCLGYLNVIGLLYGVVSIVISYIYVIKLPTELKPQFHQVGIMILLSAFTAMFIVEGIKPIWGRVRFRSMQDNFDLFTHWYQINGDKFRSFVPVTEEIKSFPSGHSEWIASVMCLSFAALVNPKWKNKETLIFTCSVVISFMVMFSRMLKGAHFLSDVTVGFSISLICFVLYRKILIKKLASINTSK